MYQLITQKTKFKGLYLYYAKYTNDNIAWENTYWFSPVIKRIYIRTQQKGYILDKGYVSDSTKEYIVLIAEGFHVVFPKDDIPTEGTFSILIDNDAIISTSKQEVARFLKKKIFKGMRLKEWSYEANNTYSRRHNQYKKCIEELKKLK